MLASSARRSSVSAIASLESAAHEHRERAGQQPRLERGLARHLAVELHETRGAVRDLDAHLAAARPPDAPAFVFAVPEEKLDHRAHALKHAVSVERHDVEPAIIGSERRTQFEK